MSDFISRKALLDQYDAEHVGSPGRARELIVTAPAVDVIEKKHGYWIKRIIENEEEDYPIRNVNYICSQCEGCWHEPLKYCPYCLAEMDKEETNELDKCEG